MDNIYRHLLRLALSALPLACVAMLSSCSFEDEVGDCGGESATVRISVSAGEIGDLNGTRVGGDENADEHEFMNTLSVYIVDGSNNIVHPFKDAIGSSNAGELTNWTSDPFELNPGVYTIYAFSNFEGHTGITDNIQNSHDAADFIAKCFDGNKIVNTTGLEQFRLEDPAEKINLTAPDGKAVFIPMSAKVEQVQVTPTTTMLSVGLVRLVSKVKLTMPSADINTDAASVTFSGYSTNVPLLGELYKEDEPYNYNTISNYYGKRNASATTTLQSETTGDNLTASLYVNETPPGKYFTVTLNTGNSSNGEISTYVSSTFRTDIPRNSIYPLALSFPDYAPQFEWQSWEAAIGAVPVEVVVEENNYIVKIASGNTFKFTVNGVNGTNSQLQSATWAHGDVTNQITDIQIGNNAISGAISAGVPAGTQISLTVTVNWTADYTDATGSTETRNFTRTYNVTIETIDIWDTKYKSSTRSGSWRAYRLTPEVLNMFIKR